MQTRLCLTCDETAAGYLKAHHAKSASRPDILPLPVRLIRKPLASAVPKLDDARVLSRLGAVERCEIYVDPDPNSQLLMTLLLAKALAAGIDCRKLHLVQGPVRWGHVDAVTPPDQMALPVPVKDGHMRAATAIWSAYASPTPEAWPRLRQEDLVHFPFMEKARDALLDDLPRRDTGLGACERLVLESVGTDGSRVGEIARIFSQASSPLIDLPQVVALLTSLASGAAPVIDGLNGRLGEDDFGDDADAWTAFRESRVRLTDVGRNVIAGDRDFIELHGIERWWGGTLLKGHACWRWDDRARVLILPTPS